ncbi:MAG: hypothetical protein Q9165_007787 [Trypethelium subeluteriae]
MTSVVPLNPRPMLQSLVNNEVLVRLKWGEDEYTGRLVSVDAFMNLQLAGTEEWKDGKNTGTLGQVLIRCVHRDLVPTEGYRGNTSKDASLQKGRYR